MFRKSCFVQGRSHAQGTRLCLGGGGELCLGVGSYSEMGLCSMGWSHVWWGLCSSMEPCSAGGTVLQGEAYSGGNSFSKVPRRTSEQY